jgi:hypothetical protein
VFTAAAGGLVMVHALLAGDESDAGLVGAGLISIT